MCFGFLSFPLLKVNPLPFLEKIINFIFLTLTRRGCFFSPGIRVTFSVDTCDFFLATPTAKTARENNVKSPFFFKNPQLFSVAFQESCYSTFKACCRIQTQKLSGQILHLIFLSHSPQHRKSIHQEGEDLEIDDSGNPIKTINKQGETPHVK